MSSIVLFHYFQEAKNDLNPSPSQDWTYSHFKERFLDLDSWLNSVQKTIYDNEDESIVQNVRLVSVKYEIKYQCGAFIELYLLTNLISQSF